MRIARTLPIAAACAALSACVAKPPPPVAAPRPVVVPPPAVPLDGVYWGTSTRFRAERRDCPHPGLVKLEVQNGQFVYRWNYRTFVDSSVAPDGTVSGQAENITLAGHRKGARIEGDVTNGYCGLHFTVTRRKPRAERKPAG